MPATDSPVSVLDAAVAAASSHGAAPLVLELREPESGGESNDLMNSGRLSAEVIQHVVRGLAATFRHCYERGLARNSALEGLVATRFVIDRAGEVRESAASSGTTLPVAWGNAAAVDPVLLGAQFLTPSALNAENESGTRHAD